MPTVSPTSPTSVGLVVVAAGSGTRLAAAVPKAFVPLAGRPLLEHALRGALACPDISTIVVVAPTSHVAEATALVRRQAEWEPSNRIDRPIHVVAGGAERGDSVAAGIAALPDEVEIVLVHDAARALTPPTVFARVVAAVRAGSGAVVPGVPVVDTVKQVDAAGRVTATPDRASLRAVQTPQGFVRNLLERAHAAGSDATDDAGLVERLGEPVLVVDGDARAFKVTTAEDLERAERELARLAPLDGV